MNVYYRGDDSVFYGDLTYYTDDNDIPKVTFRADGVSLTLCHPTVSIGVNRIHVISFGVDYLFYINKPDWVDVKYSVAQWCLDNENA